ncbi:unnamed protein product [Amoebophrya sp. A25]|nr:unnamed protein product [Amoebophrya sp. A25]|eukprot:GSA25T00010066001.1
MAPSASKPGRKTVRVFTPGEVLATEVFGDSAVDESSYTWRDGQRIATKMLKIVVTSKSSKKTTCSSKTSGKIMSKTDEEPCLVEVGDIVFGRVHQVQNDRAMIQLLAKEVASSVVLLSATPQTRLATLKRTDTRSFKLDQSKKLQLEQQKASSSSASSLKDDDTSCSSSRSTTPASIMSGYSSCTSGATGTATTTSAMFYRINDIVRAHVIAKTGDHTVLSTFHLEDGVVAAADRGLEALNHELMHDRATKKTQLRKVACTPRLKRKLQKVKK